MLDRIVRTPSGGMFPAAIAFGALAIAARRMWLFRLGVTTEHPAELAPTGVRLGELAEQLGIMERGWDDYLRRLTDDRRIPTEFVLP